MKQSLISILMAVLFNGCASYEEFDYDGCHEASYLPYSEVRKNYPKILQARDIVNAGKIYVYGDTLFIAEQGKGLHMINNRNKSAPQNTSFIEIPGNSDLAIKDNHLYVDSFSDLIVLDISDQLNIQEAYRKQDIFPYDPYQSLSEEDRSINLCASNLDSDNVVVGYQ